MQTRSPFFIFLPMLFLMFANALCALLSTILTGSASSPSLLEEPLALVFSYVYALLALLLFFVFYRKNNFGKVQITCAKSTLPTPFTSELSPVLRIALLLLSSLACYCFVSGLLRLLGLAFGGVFSDYSAEMTSLVTAYGAPIWIYSIVLSPLAEEYCFRGLTLPLAAERFGVAWAVVLQAFLFAIIHSSLPQIIYAFLLGLVIGLIYVHFGNVFYGYLFHIFFNFLNLPNLLLQDYVSSPFVWGVLLVSVGLLLGVVLRILFRRIRR